MGVDGAYVLGQPWRLTTDVVETTGPSRRTSSNGREIVAHQLTICGG